MFKKLFFIVVLIILLSLFLFVSHGICQEIEESGTYSIYFMDEQVGYEEFIWEASPRGYKLEVTGRITKPVPMEIEHLVIELDKDFIPVSFEFKGRLSGSEQDVSSVISDGNVQNTIRVAGQEQQSRVKIKRDAFLLPNPVFSPYMVITQKYKCSLEEERNDLSAYIIPQAETSFSLSPHQEKPCMLLMKLGSTVIELESDVQGFLKSLHIPSQNIRVILD